jgi:putative copper export protein
LSLPPSWAELAIGAFRWLEDLGLLAFVGVIVVRRLAANPPHLAWARMPMHPALAVALAGGVGILVGQALNPSSVGVDAGWTGYAPLATGYLFQGPNTWVLSGRVVAEGLALGMCLMGMRAVVVPGLLAGVLLAFAGHAAAVQPSAAGILVDALHILSAGMWAGGIVAMAMLRPPSGWREGEGRVLLDRFSRVAPLAFAITALTGLLRATEELSAVSDLWTTSYGGLLSVKAAAVLAMLLLSWLAWRRGLPVARVEAAVAVTVIAATALLATYPITPGEAARIIGVL